MRKHMSRSEAKEDTDGFLLFYFIYNGATSSTHRYKTKSVGTPEGPTDFYLREKSITHILHKDEERE